MAGQIGFEAYNGVERFAVAIDLGTTHSAVSFAHLYPGDRIDIRMVTAWPGHLDARGESKIPSIVAYQNGKALSFGAEAIPYLDDVNYEIAKWFKLNLHPDAMQNSDSEALEIPNLPEGVTLTTIYADFLRYLFQSTQNFFQDSTPNGSGIWQRLRAEMVVILAIPNGWDTTQQGFLRSAAIKAGLVTDTSADLCLEFVAEGEASVHYALTRTQSHTWLKPGLMFAVTDAGGSTVDSTLYQCKTVRPKLVLHEVCASECVQAGGVFVDRAARLLLERKLRSSRFGSKQTIDDMVSQFEVKTKRLFDGSQDNNIIAFGGRTETERAYNIFQGKITLSGEEVGGTFETVVDGIVGSCSKLLRGRKIQHLLLVGGFGDSPYLRGRLKDIFGRDKTEIVALDQTSKKAAAEGAMIWFTKQLVAARAARFYIGVRVNGIFDPLNIEHLQRRTHTYIEVDGRTRIPNGFETLVERNFLMQQDYRVVQPYIQQYKERPVNLGNFTTLLHAWEGNAPTKWTTDAYNHELPQIRHLCTLKADLSRLAPMLAIKTGLNGARYWGIDFKIALFFGGTKLRACLQWEEGGRIQEGPASVIAGSIL